MSVTSNALFLDWYFAWWAELNDLFFPTLTLWMQLVASGVVAAGAFLGIVYSTSRSRARDADERRLTIRAASRAWRDDFWMFQHDIADAMCGLEPVVHVAERLGDNDNFLLLSTELHGDKAWSTVAHARRMMLFAPAPLSRIPLAELLRAFDKLESARRFLLESSDRWDFREHTRATEVAKRRASTSAI